MTGKFTQKALLVLVSGIAILGLVVPVAQAVEIAPATGGSPAVAVDGAALLDGLAGSTGIIILDVGKLAMLVGIGSWLLSGLSAVWRGVSRVVGRYSSGPNVASRNSSSSSSSSRYATSLR